MALTRRTLTLGGLAAPFVMSPAIMSRVHAAPAIAQGMAFGSPWRLISAAPLSPSARTAMASIIVQVDEQMSPYLPGSDLSRFNARHDDQWQSVPRDLGAVVRTALDMAQFTDGAFDPTVGPIVQRFGFGPIEGAMGQHDQITVADGALRKHAPGLTLDLCGIAKGYALDQITLALLEEGARAFTLELGGEVRTQGQHPDGRDWRIAIEDPNGDGSIARHIVEPRQMALATSGHTVNGVSLVGPSGTLATSHIIDPQTKRPVLPYAASVSVLASSAMRADGLATALAAMGTHGPGFAEHHDISALFLSGASEPPRMTGSFADHIYV
jgi:thiamine biosynthesis lipoprotein